MSFFYDVIVYVITSTIFAIIRGISFFIPGFYGIAVGILTGKISQYFQKGHEADLNIKENIFKVMMATAIYIIMNLIIIGTLRSSPDGNCVSWLEDIMQGYTSEPFFSISRYRGILVKGDLEAGFWLFYMILDALFFAFAFMLAKGSDIRSQKE